MSIIANIGTDGTAEHRMAVDPGGNVYVVDSNLIRRVDVRTGEVTTIAGTASGNQGIGDNGPASQAYLEQPSQIAVDGKGNLFIADISANRVRRVDAETGIITTIVGNGRTGATVEGVAATATSIIQPTAVAADDSGNVYVSSLDARRVYKVDSSGIITRFMGTYPMPSGDGAQVQQATSTGGRGIAVDSRGNIYFAESAHHSVRKVDVSTGMITTIAGNGTAGLSGDSGPANLAQLNSPNDVAVDGIGNIYIADTSNSRVRKVDAATGTISSLPGEVSQAMGVAVGRDGTLYVALYLAAKVVKLDPSRGIVSDWDLPLMSFATPMDIATDNDGNLLVADGWNIQTNTGNVIRKVDIATRSVTVVAGIDGPGGFSGDGGPATAARLFHPQGVTVDGSGNIYIVSNTDRIRKVDAQTGTISTIAGGAGASFSEGSPAASVMVGTPSGVAVSAQGQVYFTGTSTVRVLTASGGAAPCQAQITPASVSVPAGGSTFPVKIAVGSPECFWSLSGLPGWITPDTVSGFGSRDITLIAVSNLDAPRKATISAGGASIEVNQNASLPPALSARKYHINNSVGQGGVITYRASVCNAGGPLTGALTATEVPPDGLSVSDMNSPRGTCTGKSCSRDGLLHNEGWDINVYAAVGNDAPPNLTNTITVSAGGAVLASASDSISVTQFDPPVLASPANGATGAPYDVKLTWTGNWPNYDIYLGESSPPQHSYETRTPVYSGWLKPLTTYYWRIVGKYGTKTVSSEIWSFKTGSGAPWFPRLSFDSVVSATSFQRGMAYGSWISIFGQYLSPTTRSWRPDEIVNGVLPTQLDGVRVTINGQPLAISFISPNQINAQAPNNPAEGYYGGIVVENAFGKASTLLTAFERVVPSFFLYDALSRRYVAAQHADGSMIGPPGLYPGVTSTPAKPGETVVLYGSGFGETNPLVPSGRVVTVPVPVENLSYVRLTIGGIQAKIDYCGITMAGVWQINAVIPDGVPDGDAVVRASTSWDSGRPVQENAHIAVRR